MTFTFKIIDLIPYINWAYFYYAWGVKADQQEGVEIRSDAERLLRHYSLNGVVARAVFELLPAYSEGDDVVMPDGRRLSFLRQQHDRSNEPCYCLADFIAPRDYHDATHVADRLGLFATSVAAAHVCPCCEGNILLAQTVKDRLAEAAAELLHLNVRKTLWGYAPDEQLSISALHSERFQGIRPAVGYPSMPDQSLIFDLDRYLHLSQIGITLTDNGMMQPHASTCGLMLAHPSARYFDVGHVAADQLADYARRREMSSEFLQKFLP